MAFIDYGAIAFKNNKIISTKMFTPMKDTCGFSDKDDPQSDFDGDYFVICGDKDLIIGFYRERLAWRSNLLEESEHKGEEWFSCSCYLKWKRWVKDIYYASIERNSGYKEVSIIVKPNNGYYVAKWEYKGDNYKVYFGYGVDLNFYKKTKRVNYYRSPEYVFNNFLNLLRRLRLRKKSAFKKNKNIINKITKGEQK